MLDMVHLEWKSVAVHGYPTDTGCYICLVEHENTGQVDIDKLYFSMGDGKPYYTALGFDFDVEPKNVVAWVDPEAKIMFECDPERKSDCSGSGCYKNGGPCWMTTDINAMRRE